MQGTVKTLLAEHKVKVFGVIDVLSPEARTFVKDCDEA